MASIETTLLGHTAAGNGIPSPDEQDTHWQEIKLIQDSRGRVWSLYTQWYQWYWALTLAAAYFVVSNKLNRYFVIAFGICWVLSVISGTIGGFYLIRYTKDSSRQIENLLRLIGRDKYGTTVENMLGNTYGIYAAWSNTIVLLVAGIGWIFLICTVSDSG
jgi:hypothetical protein